MSEIAIEWLPIGKAARKLGVAPSTLRRWEREGRIAPMRTVGGARRYRVLDIDALTRSPAGSDEGHGGPDDRSADATRRGVAGGGPAGELDPPGRVSPLQGDAP